MSLAFIVYLISVLPSIKWLFVFASVLGCFAFPSGFIFFEDKFKWKLPAAILVLVAFTAAIIPSEKQMYVIAGAYATQEVYNSEIGQDTVKLIHAKIKEQLEEVQKKVGE